MERKENVRGEDAMDGVAPEKEVLCQAFGEET